MPQLRPSVAVVCLWHYVLWLNGASWSKSYCWQPTGSRIWEIDWYRNEWPWPLFREGCIKGMSTIASQSPLFNYRYSENVSDRCLVPKDHHRKWLWVTIKWSRDWSRHVTIKGQTRDCNTLRAQYLENSWRCYLATNPNYSPVCCGI